MNFKRVCVGGGGGVDIAINCFTFESVSEPSVHFRREMTEMHQNMEKKSPTKEGLGRGWDHLGEWH